MNKSPSIITILVAIGSLAIEICTVVFYGGKLSAKVDQHDEYIKEQKQKSPQDRVDIEVLRAEMKGIARAVDRIEQKLDEKNK